MKEKETTEYSYTRKRYFRHAYCSRDSTTRTLRMRLYIIRGSEMIYRVYPVTSQFIEWNNSTCKIDMSSSTAIESIHYVNIDTLAYTNECGAAKTAGTNRFTWRFRIRKDPSEIWTHAGDKIYLIECNYDTAIDTYTQTVVEVVDTIQQVEAIKPVNESLSLIAVDTNNQRVTNVKLGDIIKLEMVMDLNDNYRDNLSPYGVAPYNCKASGSCNFDQAYTEQIINADGCPNTASNVVLDPSKEFIKRVTTATVFRTTSGTFEVRTFTGQPSQLCFSCYVLFCFGNRSSSSDKRCDNFCLNPSESGRRKRQTSLEEGTKIILKLNVDSGAVVTESSHSEVMPIILIVTAVVLLIAISAIVCFAIFFKHWRGLCEYNKTLAPYKASPYVPGSDVGKY
ncbi:hypothetical protein CHS0354_015384 [Potamilus streckersoni]|uniref:ZP domain-containing protein n=1 Tax=Potamilus streckersoni TaxID=2493646 RepID=A0AAE0S0Y9_9BIVA|nr:hypothetical protein CHS0354_015384 [Potamilus streckersoni]